MPDQALQTQDTLTLVIELLRTELQLGERASSFTEDTGLFGSLPEFDSMSVVSLISAMEEQFGMVIEDEDITEEVFSSVGGLVRFVDAKTG